MEYRLNNYSISIHNTYNAILCTFKKTEAELHELIPQASLGILLCGKSKLQKSAESIIPLRKIQKSMFKPVSVILFTGVFTVL